MGYNKGVIGAYRAIHEQAFLPIFTADDFDSKPLVEATLAAGCRVVEYTLRRRDAHEMIPWIRKNYPGVVLLVGSALDDDAIVRQMRVTRPQLRTLDELAELGVDGFVSPLGWKPENIRRFAATHVVIPAVMTPSEAYLAVGTGAHFVKLMGPDLGTLRQCRMEAMHGYCPIMLTGGQSFDRIPDSIAAGALVIGTGFDLMLGTRGGDVPMRSVTETVAKYLKVTQSARALNAPATVPAAGISDASWLASLTHAHPM
jgi:2-keto-3-deoxy-6-phosphogluconate aldolase